MCAVYDWLTYVANVSLLLLKPDLQVHEGRNHEVRELVKNAGLEVSFDVLT